MLVRKGWIVFITWTGAQRILHVGKERLERGCLPWSDKAIRLACQIVDVVVSALPLAIRSDNGVPFASPNALFNLSKLSVWWLRLGIAIERIKPGHSQQNGRHERMHLTLKKEATRPPGFNSLQQQERFDAFVEEFNAERPHEALDMKCPAELYSASPRPYHGLPELTYPFHDRDIFVTACGGSACTVRRSTSQPCWPVKGSASRKSTTAFGSSASCTMISDISTWSRKPCNPSTTRSARGCHPCLRYVLLPMCPGRTLKTLERVNGIEPSYSAWKSPNY